MWTAAAADDDRVGHLQLDERAERLPHRDRVHAVSLQRRHAVPGRHVQELHLVARDSALLQEDRQVLVGRAADRRADALAHEILDLGDPAALACDEGDGLIEYLLVRSPVRTDDPLRGHAALDRDREVRSTRSR
jgi:hypothetical protein